MTKYYKVFFLFLLIISIISAKDFYPWELGLHFGSPATGLSARWWINENIAIQTMGLRYGKNNNFTSQGGSRILFSTGLKKLDNIAGNSRIYLALGAGSLYNRAEIEARDGIVYDQPLSFGDFLLILLTLGAYQPPYHIKYVTHEIVDLNRYKEVSIGFEYYDFSFLAGELLPGLYIEVGAEEIEKYHRDNSYEERNKASFAKLSAGFHLAF